MSWIWIWICKIGLDLDLGLDLAKMLHIRPIQSSKYNNAVVYVTYMHNIFSVCTYMKRHVPFYVCVDIYDEKLSTVTGLRVTDVGRQWEDEDALNLRFWEVKAHKAWCRWQHIPNGSYWSNFNNFGTI